MKLFIVDDDTGHRLELNVVPTHTIADVLYMADMEGQQLSFADRILHESSTLADCKVQHRDQIHVAHRGQNHAPHAGASSALPQAGMASWDIPPDIGQSVPAWWRGSGGVDNPPDRTVQRCAMRRLSHKTPEVEAFSQLLPKCNKRLQGAKALEESLRTPSPAKRVRGLLMTPEPCAPLFGSETPSRPRSSPFLVEFGFDHASLLPAEMPSDMMVPGVVKVAPAADPEQTHPKSLGASISVDFAFAPTESISAPPIICMTGAYPSFGEGVSGDMAPEQCVSRHPNASFGSAATSPASKPSAAGFPITFGFAHASTTLPAASAIGFPIMFGEIPHAKPGPNVAHAFSEGLAPSVAAEASHGKLPTHHQEISCTLGEALLAAAAPVAAPRFISTSGRAANAASYPSLAASFAKEAPQTRVAAGPTTDAKTQSYPGHDASFAKEAPRPRVAAQEPPLQKFPKIAAKRTPKPTTFMETLLSASPPTIGIDGLLPATPSTMFIETLLPTTPFEICSRCTGSPQQDPKQNFKAVGQRKKVKSCSMRPDGAHVKATLRTQEQKLVNAKGSKKIVARSNARKLKKAGDLMATTKIATLQVQWM